MTPDEIATFAERFLIGDFTPEEADAFSISDLVALNDYLDKQKWFICKNERDVQTRYCLAFDDPLIA